MATGFSLEAAARSQRAARTKAASWREVTNTSSRQQHNRAACRQHLSSQRQRRVARK